MKCQSRIQIFGRRTAFSIDHAIGFVFLLDDFSSELTSVQLALFIMTSRNGGRLRLGIKGTGRTIHYCEFTSIELLDAFSHAMLAIVTDLKDLLESNIRN